MDLLGILLLTAGWAAGWFTQGYGGTPSGMFPKRAAEHLSHVADSRSETLGDTSTERNDFPSEPQSHISAAREINIRVTGFMSLLPWATRINTGRSGNMNS